VTEFGENEAEAREMRSETRIRGAVLGVDIGYSRDRNTTGLCLLKWDEERVSVTCVNTGTPSSQRRLDLQSLVPEGTQLAAVAIDGPLTRGLQEISRYRSAEALLSRGVFQKRGKPGQTNSGNGQDLHLSATAFAWLLLDLEASGWLSLSASEHSEPIHNTAMVEAFPNQFLAALVDEREIPR